MYIKKCCKDYYNYNSIPPTCANNSRKYFNRKLNIIYIQISAIYIYIIYICIHGKLHKNRYSPRAIKGAFHLQRDMIPEG